MADLRGESVAVRQWLYGTLGVLITSPAWMIGAVHVQSQLFLTALSLVVLVSLLFWNWSLPTKAKRTLSTDGFFWLFCVCLFVTVVQWLPWPQTLLQWTSPESFRVWKSALSSVGLYDPGRWLPYTLAPGDTASKLVRDLGALVLYFAVFQWVRERWHLKLLLQVLVSSACLLSLVVLVQTVLGMPHPLGGLYLPAVPPDGLLKGSPLINPNHLGGYLLFHTMLAYTLLNESHKEWEKAVWASASFLLTGMVFLSLSRGSILSLGVGFSFFFVLNEFLYRRRSRRARQRALEAEARGEEQEASGQRKRRTPLFSRLWKKPSTRSFLLVGMLLLSLVVSFASESLKREVKSTSFSVNKDKVHFIRTSSAPLLKAFPMLGVGRGAQAMVWSRHSGLQRPDQSQVTLSHVESLLVQPLVDWGWGIGVLFLLLGAGLFFRLGWVLEHPLDAGAWLAIAMLLLQNCGDFNLEFAATAFPALALLAGLSRLRLTKKARLSRMPASLAVLASIAGVGMLVWWGGYAWKHDYHRLPPVWKQFSKVPLEKLPAKTAYWMQHHPSDYILPLVVAQRLVRMEKGWQPKRALQWLERAEYRNPTSPDLFFLRGYIYARLGLGREAGRTFGRAVELRPRYLTPAVLALSRYKHLLVSIKATDSARLASALLAQWLQKRGSTSDALKLAESTLKRFPRSLTLHQLVGTQYINSLVSGKQWSRQVRLRLERKTERFLQLMRRRFASLSGYDELIQARLLQFRGQTQKALKLYRGLFQKQNPHRWSSFVYMVPLLMKSSEESRLNVLFQEARQHFLNLSRRSEIAFLEGRWHEVRRRYRKALESFNEAIQIRALPKYSLGRARVCLKLSMFQCTLQVYKSLVRKKRYQYLKVEIERVRIRRERARSVHPHDSLK